MDLSPEYWGLFIDALISSLVKGSAFSISMRGVRPLSASICLTPWIKTSLSMQSKIWYFRRLNSFAFAHLLKNFNANPTMFIFCFMDFSGMPPKQLMKFRCISCLSEYPATKVRYTCACGNLLEVAVDFRKIGRSAAQWK